MVDRRPSLDRHLSILLYYPSSLSKPRPMDAVVEKEYELLRRSESWDDRAPSCSERLLRRYRSRAIRSSCCMTRVASRGSNFVSSSSC